MKKVSEAITTELQKVLDTSDDGLLHEEAVVQRARSPKSALHAEFDWKDTEAAHSWRLEQARRLITRAYVTLETREGDMRQTRAFVSLSSQRVQGGGYHPMVTVLKNPTQYDELLRTALAELENLRRRYEQLSELKPLFLALSKLKGKGKGKGKENRPQA